MPNNFQAFEYFKMFSGRFGNSGHANIGMEILSRYFSNSHSNLGHFNVLDAREQAAGGGELGIAIKLELFLQAGVIEDIAHVVQRGVVVATLVKGARCRADDGIALAAVVLASAPATPGGGGVAGRHARGGGKVGHEGTG